MNIIYSGIEEKTAILTKYGFNSKKEVFSDNSVNLILGGQIYANSDGIRIEDIPSLKDCEFCNKIKLVVQEDKDFPVSVIDYNWTSIKIKFSIVESQKGLDIPIKIFLKENESDFQYNSSIKLAIAGETPELVLPFGVDKELKFGTNSTNITIQEANTQNLDDTWVQRLDNPAATDGGIDSSLSTDATRNWRIYFKFNLSQIPITASVSNAILQLHGLSADGGTTLKIYHVNTSSWSEDTMSHNNQPCGSSFNDGTKCNFTIEYQLVTDGVINDEKFNITNLTNRILYNPIYGKNMSFVIDDDTGTADQTFFNSKEIATTAFRPLLNITYKLNDINITIQNMSVENPLLIVEGQNLTINFTVKSGGIEILSDLNINNVTVGGVLCNILTNPFFCNGDPSSCVSYSIEGGCLNASCTWDNADCSGTPSVCSSYSIQEGCTNASCSWGGEGASPNYAEPFTNTGSPPTNWATWGSETTGIFSEVNDITRCINDANDDCMCIDDNSDVITNINILSKQTNVDLSGCVNGTGYVYFGKVWETGTLEAIDCINITLSFNGGVTYPNSTRVFCDDSPASTRNITLSRQFHTNAFRMQIKTSAWGGTSEVGCVDELIIGCQPKSGTCSGTPTNCNIYTNNSRCSSSGCVWDNADCSGTPTNCNIYTNSSRCLSSGCLSGGNDQQFGYGETFQVNVSIPEELLGLHSLDINVNYDDNVVNTTSLNSTKISETKDIIYLNFQQETLNITSYVLINETQKRGKSNKTFYSNTFYNFIFNKNYTADNVSMLIDTEYEFVQNDSNLYSFVEYFSNGTGRYLTFIPTTNDTSFSVEGIKGHSFILHFGNIYNFNISIDQR